MAWVQQPGMVVHVYLCLTMRVGWIVQMSRFAELGKDCWTIKELNLPHTTIQATVISVLCTRVPDILQEMDVTVTKFSCISSTF